MEPYAFVHMHISVCFYKYLQMEIYIYYLHINRRICEFLLPQSALKTSTYPSLHLSLTAYLSLYLSAGCMSVCALSRYRCSAVTIWRLPAHIVQVFKHKTKNNLTPYSFCTFMYVHMYVCIWKIAKFPPQKCQLAFNIAIQFMLRT